MKNCRALVIGGSAGSLEVLLRVFPDLREDLPFSIIIVVHRKQGTDFLLADLISKKTKLEVKEAEEKEKIMVGTVYLAPSDYHLLIERDGSFSLDYSEKINYSRPSIDVTFQSAAEVYEEGLVCLLLSGSNADGVNGLITVSSYGGQTAVQDPESAQVDYMPAQAIARAEVNRILKIEEMAAYINSLA